MKLQTKCHLVWFVNKLNETKWHLVSFSSGPTLVGPSGVFSWSGSGLTTILRPTNVDYQVLFWISPYLLFLIWSNYVPLCTFWAHWGCLWGWDQVEKYFLEHIYVDNQLWF